MIRCLRNTSIRMFFIDEFQHVLGRNQDDILEQLKHKMDFVKIPFIPMGTPDVKKVLQLDLQLADRCPIKDYTELSNWEFDNEVRRFLAGYEKFLPFPEPSKLSSRNISTLIWNRVKFDLKGNIVTNLRHLVRYLKKVAVRSLRTKNDCISEEIINNTSY